MIYTGFDRAGENVHCRHGTEPRGSAFMFAAQSLPVHVNRYLFALCVAATWLDSIRLIRFKAIRADVTSEDRRRK
jgi:hypothetical protein